MLLKGIGIYTLYLLELFIIKLHLYVRAVLMISRVLSPPPHTPIKQLCYYNA